MTRAREFSLPNRWGDNRNAIHQHLWKAFPLEQGESQPFLFRVEIDSVLVRSRSRPYLEGVVVRDGLHLPSRGELKIHLNVSRRLKGKTLTVREEDVEPFVLRKIGQMGLRVTGNLVIVPFATSNYAGVKLTPVSVRADVSVENSEVLARAMLMGIGRAKFLGFGMPMMMASTSVRLTSSEALAIQVDP